MSIMRVRVSDGVGETRAAAFLDDGRPCGLFMHRLSDRDRPRWGSVLDARIAALAPEQGGAFVDLDNGTQAFLRADASSIEGQRLAVMVEAEARPGKLARVKKTKKRANETTTLDRWLASLPGDPEVDSVLPGDSDIDAAFEEAEAETTTLPGGGTLTLSRTPAFTAIDVDTAGRVEKGSPASRALAINVAAADEAARQMALRNLGGALVLDCVAPVQKSAGPRIKAELINAFRAMDPRKIEALAPSPFGLLEGVIAWRWMPIEAHRQDADKMVSMETQILDSVRRLEREAIARRNCLFDVALPPTWNFSVYDRAWNVSGALAAKYGARFRFVDAVKDTAHISAHENS